MKKVFAIVLALAMIVALAACAAPATPSASAPASSAASSAAPSSSAPSVSPSASETPKGPAGPEVLQDPRVRKALSLAIDRVYICKQVWNNARTPAYAVVPGGLLDATPDKQFRDVGGNLISDNYEENVKEAQKLLADAGFPGGQGFPKLEYSYNSNDSQHKGVAEALQNEWKTNLGIDVELAGMEWNTFQDYRKTNDCQIARQGWIGDYADPSTFMDLFLSTAGNNDGHYTSAKYDQLVKDAKALGSDPVKRMQMYHDAEKLIIDEAGIAPIAFYTNEVLAQQDFKDYGATPMGNLMFWATSKDNAKINVGPQPNTLDPNLNKSVDGMVYDTHLFEGLYRLNLDGSFSLGQAKEEPKKEAEADGSVKYTFTLRDDIFWSDGKPVTANDFVFSWRRLMDPATASDYAYLGDGFFKNGGDVMAGKAKPEELSVKAIDDKTLEVELASDIPFAKEIFAFANFNPVREDVVKKSPDKWATKADSIVTNGRYIVKEFKNEDKIVMVKNDKYWDKDSTKITTINFNLMNDTNAILAAFKNKELDFFYSTIPSEEREALQKTPEYHQLPYVGLYYVQFNNIAVAK